MSVLEKIVLFNLMLVCGLMLLTNHYQRQTRLDLERTADLLLGQEQLPDGWPRTGAAREALQIETTGIGGISICEKCPADPNVPDGEIKVCQGHEEIKETEQ